MRTLMQLHPPSEGQIFFKDQEITGLKGEDARNMRRNIQMVFQDPTTSFNPKMKIKDIICEPLRNFGLLEGSARDKAAELLRLVDLPEEFAERYPANMSGGQRQRVGIARALALVRASDGLDYAQEQADAYLVRAKAALPASLDPRIRETCLMAADFIGRREF